MSKKIYIFSSFNPSMVRLHSICSTTHEKKAIVIINKVNYMTIEELVGKFIAANFPSKPIDFEKLFTEKIELSDIFDVPAIMQKPTKNKKRQKLRKPKTADLIKATTDLKERKNKEIYIQNKIKNTYQKHNQIYFGRTKHK